MPLKTLRRQIALSYLLVILLCLGGTAWYGATALHRYYMQQAAGDLEDKARIASHVVVDSLTAAPATRWDALCRKLADGTTTRFTIIGPDGSVRGDSVQSSEVMENHAGRPEVVKARSGRTGMAVRFSTTLGQWMLYVAVPMNGPDGHALGVMRASMPMILADRILAGAYGHLIAAGLLISLAALVLSWLVARRISRPIESLKTGVERFAAGDLSFRLPDPGVVELGQLADAMNRMGGQLSEKIDTIASQRNAQEAVLSSMVEGVLAVDNHERILNLNQAAARLLDVTTPSAVGRTIQETVRNSDLQAFIASTAAGTGPQEGEIRLYRDEERVLQVHGTLLLDGAGKRIGALVVLNDITRLKRLETMRRDFVANVSHELRTPVTSIKGFVETLMDGALDRPEDARRFLAIIAQQSDRLNALIEDLLILAKVENDSERQQIRIEPGAIQAVIEAAVQACKPAANDKSIRLEPACPGDLQGLINPRLLEQALVNLIENAIKYSPSGTCIRIVATAEEKDITLRVIDEGCGIEAQYLPRLFERFYRVDKGRSRTLGGTGLGLAIVKHIVSAHHGRVAVDSEVGKGSTFILVLPR